MAEKGYAGLTVAEVVARAKISRRTFYDLFEDREACFLGAFDEALARAREPVVAAYASERAWRERIAAALSALLTLFDQQPALGRLLVVDTLAAGPAALARRAGVQAALAHAVEQGRAECTRGYDPGPLAAEGVVGAVLAILHTRLLEDGRRRRSLRSLAGPLMGMIVLPYLGVEAAVSARERTPAAPKASPAKAMLWRVQANPLQGLDMRLTYRTLRVLCAVADHPHASNREVAEGAGIIDQGQISKLLARLRSLGLIENRSGGRVSGSSGRAGGSGGRASRSGGRAGGSGGRVSGESNSWTLTPRGTEVVDAIGDRSAAH